MAKQKWMKYKENVIVYTIHKMTLANTALLLKLFLLNLMYFLLIVWCGIYSLETSFITLKHSSMRIQLMFKSIEPTTF